MCVFRVFTIIVNRAMKTFQEIRHIVMIGMLPAARSWPKNRVGGRNFGTERAVVNFAPANAAVFPWVAAHSGTVDVVYYGTSTANTAGAMWNVYLAQTTDNGASFTQSLVSNKPNHVGVICTNGTGCAPGTRNLLDLFQVAIDPINESAAIVYVDDTLTKDSSGNPLPQTVLAQQQ